MKNIAGKLFKCTFLLALAITTMQCTTKQASNENHNTTENVEETIETIELINGQKWQVNFEMKPFIMQAEERFNAFTPSENLNDYLKLADDLKNFNNNLISSCTMKGKSHDELHKWLHPHLGLVKQLSTAQNTADANAVLAKLKASFENYHKYFE